MNPLKRSTGVLAVLLPLVTCLASPAEVQAQAADRVYVNGNIYTVDESFTTASALAVLDGRVTYVGSDAGVQAHVGPNTQVFDLDGGDMNFSRC